MERKRLAALRRADCDPARAATLRRLTAEPGFSEFERDNITAGP